MSNVQLEPLTSKHIELYTSGGAVVLLEKKDFRVIGILNSVVIDDGECKIVVSPRLQLSNNSHPRNGRIVQEEDRPIPGSLMDEYRPFKLNDPQTELCGIEPKGHLKISSNGTAAIISALPKDIIAFARILADYKRQ